MSTVATLVSDIRYFPRVAAANSSPKIDLKDVSIDKVKQGVRAIFGADFGFTNQTPPKLTGLALFDTLSTILPFSSYSSFFWAKGIPCVASMLDTAEFPLSAQLSILLFIYARVIGFLGPTSNTTCALTPDGSPVEPSWVFNRTAHKPGEPNRAVRFAFQPIHPTSGVHLKGADVLDYLFSPEVGQGMLQYATEDDEIVQEWRRKTENFLFPDAPEDKIPEGTRFTIGFDFTAAGKIVVKMYYPLAYRPAPTSLAKNLNYPVYCGDTDFTPFRKLIERLDPTMLKALDKLITYFDTLEPRLKYRIVVLSLDCVPSSINRIKFYVMTDGASWSDVVNGFTLGGTLSTPFVLNSMDALEKLWNILFPSNSSLVNPTRDLELSTATKKAQYQKSKSKANRELIQYREAGAGFLGYYYELASGKDEVTPKIYLPVRSYLDSDWDVSVRLEEFFDQVGIHGPAGSEKGWVAKEVEKSYNHRDLRDQTGIYNYLTFGPKKAGYDVTAYFSPELWTWA